MKIRYYILIGGILGFVLNFALFVYGDRIIESTKQEFLGVIEHKTDVIVYKAQESDSKIAIMWAEKEPMPWKEALTVRVGSPKENNVRQIIFQKQ